MEVSDPPDPVQFSQRSNAQCVSNPACRHQCLGPVVRCGERDLQQISLGEYLGCTAQAPLVNVPVSSSTDNENVPGIHVCSDTELSCNIRVYYQNTRGLKTKLDEVYLAVLNGIYDVYIFTETWLDSKINSVQLFGDSFNVYRVDRSAFNSIRSRGGGLLIAVSNSLVSCLVGDGQFPSIETVWVKISTTLRNVFIGAVYIPPEMSSDCEVIQMHLNAVEFSAAIAKTNDLLIWLGDFNQPGLVWSTTVMSSPTQYYQQLLLPVACFSMALLIMDCVKLM